MKKIASLLTALILAFSTNAHEGDGNKPDNEIKSAAATYSLSGSVLDIQADEFLAGATIIINGKKYYSDLTGNFNIPELTKGKHKIMVELVSYQMQEIEVDLSKDKEIKIEMKQQ